MVAGTHTVRYVNVQDRYQDERDNIEHDIKSSQSLELLDCCTLQPINWCRQRSIANYEERDQQMFSCCSISGCCNTSTVSISSLTPKIGVRAQQQCNGTTKSERECIQVEEEGVQV